MTKEREPHDELFYALHDVLARLKEREFSYDDVVSWELRILEILGFMPNFESCVYCGRSLPEEDKTLFSRERGGVLCARCSRSLPYKTYGQGVIPRLIACKTAAGRPATSGFYGASFSEDGRAGLSGAGFVREAQDIMEGFTSFHLDVEFRSYRILKGLLLKG